MRAKEHFKPYTRTISTLSLIHSFIHSNFRSPCLIFLHSRQWLRFIYADSFLMFRFVPNSESTKVKKANERCVFGLYSFLSLFVNFSLFFVCQPSEYAAQNKHKFIYTHTFTCKHKWKWPQRYAHFNAHEEKSILIHATHLFAFLSLSFSLRHRLVATPYLCYASPFAPFVQV